MSKPKFVYVAFIRATPEMVWEALTILETGRDFEPTWVEEAMPWLK